MLLDHSQWGIVQATDTSVDNDWNFDNRLFYNPVVYSSVTD